MRTTKQARKYNIKTTEEKPFKEPKAKEAKSKNVFRVLIDNANFLGKHYDTYEEADEAGRKFCQGSRAVWMVVEGSK